MLTLVLLDNQAHPVSSTKLVPTGTTSVSTARPESVVYSPTTSTPSSFLKDQTMLTPVQASFTGDETPPLATPT